MPILQLLMVEHPIGLALNLHFMQSSIALSVSRAAFAIRGLWHIWVIY
jgi:hypothetical protein